MDKKQGGGGGKGRQMLCGLRVKGLQAGERPKIAQGRFGDVMPWLISYTPLLFLGRRSGFKINFSCWSKTMGAVEPQLL